MFLPLHQIPLPQQSMEMGNSHGSFEHSPLAPLKSHGGGTAQMAEHLYSRISFLGEEADRYNSPTRGMLATPESFKWRLAWSNHI